MQTQLRLGDTTIDVVLKDVKNIHLSVYPPTGTVRIAAPARMSVDTIRAYALTKLGWIRAQQERFRQQARETPREYIERESHYVWGERYLLSVLERSGAPGVARTPGTLVLTVRPGMEREARQELLAAWYRREVRAAATACIARWEPVLGVTVQRLYVQRMKTRWGSCNPKAGALRLNTDLAKKPPECLEYLVVHEMVHFLEPTHNKRFHALMDQFLPSWRHHRQALNRLPVSHVDWEF